MYLHSKLYMELWIHANLGKSKLLIFRQRSSIMVHHGEKEQIAELSKNGTLTKPISLLYLTNSIYPLALLWIELPCQPSWSTCTWPWPQDGPMPPSSAEIFSLLAFRSSIRSLETRNLVTPHTCVTLRSLVIPHGCELVEIDWRHALHMQYMMLLASIDWYVCHARWLS
jgi:hypothetical protein